MGVGERAIRSRSPVVARAALSAELRLRPSTALDRSAARSSRTRASTLLWIQPLRLILIRLRVSRFALASHGTPGRCLARSIGGSGSASLMPERVDLERVEGSLAPHGSKPIPENEDQLARLLPQEQRTTQAVGTRLALGDPDAALSILQARPAEDRAPCALGPWASRARYRLPGRGLRGERRPVGRPRESRGGVPVGAFLPDGPVGFRPPKPSDSQSREPPLPSCFGLRALVGLREPPLVGLPCPTPAESSALSCERCRVESSASMRRAGRATRVPESGRRGDLRVCRGAALDGGLGAVR
jgi:hypothetical protein